MEAIAGEREIDRILLQKGSNNEMLAELNALAREHRIPVSKVPPEKLDRITRKNHQGAIAFLSAITYRSLEHVLDQTFAEGRTPLLLLLDRVTDVRNFGAIARSAECAGADAMIIPFLGAAQVNADAMKTSAGALNHIAVCREPDMARTVKYLQDWGVTTVAVTEKAEKTIYELDLSGPIALILGSEEDGISDDIITRCDHLGKIPMNGKIESLNVSVSAGITLFETMRQRAIS